MMIALASTWPVPAMLDRLTPGAIGAYYVLVVNVSTARDVFGEVRFVQLPAQR